MSIIGVRDFGHHCKAYLEPIDSIKNKVIMKIVDIVLGMPN